MTLYSMNWAGVKHNSPREWRNELNIPVPDEQHQLVHMVKVKWSQERWHWDSGKKVNGRLSSKTGFAIAINTGKVNVDKIVKEHENE